MDDISSELAASLALLTDALDDPEVDIEDLVSLLAVEARSAVGSFLGLTAIISGDLAVALTVFAEPKLSMEIRASMRIPLRGNRVGDGVVLLILYAGRPGAFVDLAADLAWMSDRNSAVLKVELDQHLHPDELPEGTVTLRDAAIINQAVGVLIARGATPEGALRNIDTRAARDGIGRTGVATQIVETLNPSPKLGITPRERLGGASSE